MLARGEQRGMLSIVERPETFLASPSRATRRAFSPNLDQRFVYPGDSYMKTVDEVRLALHRREGLVVITGEIGTGKTMLCRTLLQRLDASACVSIVLDPHLTVDELLVHVLMDFGVIEDTWVRHPSALMASRHQLITVLQRFLRSLIPLGAYAVIIIDEAQNLNADLLEQIRLLLNFETEEAKLLQVVLVGQPDLGRLLRRPEMRKLDQRITRRCELRPLLPDEVTGYIERRLLVSQRLTPPKDAPARHGRNAGAAEPSVHFAPSAVHAVAKLSHGVPRLINRLCGRALEIERDGQTVIIDARTIRAAARHLNPRIASVPRMRGTREALVVAALLLSGGGGVLWTRAGDQASSPQTAASAASPYLPGDQDPIVSPLVELGALPSAESFNIAAASFRAEGQARVAAAKLEALGLPTYTRHSPGSAWLQLVVGPYVSEQEVKPVQERLVAYGYSDARVFIDPAPSLEGETDSHEPLRSIAESAGVATAGARPAGPRFERILLLRSGVRPSLVLELTEEPQKAVVRDFGRGLEVDVGPVITPVHARDLKVPAAASPIADVSVRESRSADAAVFVRARIILLGRLPNDLRIVGRRVYIDFAAREPRPDQGAPIVPVTDTPAPQRDASSISSNGGKSEIIQYRETIRPIVARLHEIGPFLLSATTNPTSDNVLGALAQTLTAVHESLRATAAPFAARPAHNLLVSAVVLATRTAEPEFGGDRLAQAHRALAMVEAAEAQLPGAAAGFIP